MAQPVHKFKVGTTVRFSPPAFGSSARPGTYTIVRQLPPEATECHYRVKSAEDGHERMVVESQLKPTLS